MTSAWLLVSALLGLPGFGQGMNFWQAERESKAERESNGPEMARTPGWIQSVSNVLAVEGIKHPENQTAIVTFAGKRDLSYIDGAIMLGLSIKKHLPGYPMVCLVIDGMHYKYEKLLKKAGWTVVVVPNWDKEYCGSGCNFEFLGRWHDSFEKINTFRLPFQQVLFLDSDTYVFNSKIQEVFSRTKTMPVDHIAMAMDGCKEEFNSGVMLFKPDLKLFVRMLHLVSERQREQILDQNLVNDVYHGKIWEIPREFNCVDTMGVQPSQRKACEFRCSENAVVAHFTGHPKPTMAKRRLLELVRRPGSARLACTNTNFGACEKWSEYYCHIREHSQHLSPKMQEELHLTGDCCHSPFDPNNDRESCKECPSSLELKGPFPEDIAGVYVKTNLKSAKYNGKKPIYLNRGNGKANPVYMYYVQHQVLWMISPNYSSNVAYSYAAVDAQCPRDASSWHFSEDGAGWVVRPVTLKAVPNRAPFNDTEHIVWNVKRRRWDREKIEDIAPNLSEFHVENTEEIAPNLSEFHVENNETTEP